MNKKLNKTQINAVISYAKHRNKSLQGIHMYVSKDNGMLYLSDLYTAIELDIINNDEVINAVKSKVHITEYNDNVVPIIETFFWQSSINPFNRVLPVPENFKELVIAAKEKAKVDNVKYSTIYVKPPFLIQVGKNVLDIIKLNRLMQILRIDTNKCYLLHTKEQTSITHSYMRSDYGMAIILPIRVGKDLSEQV